MEHKPYRVFLGGDFHCGHNVGLTPPEWQTTDNQRALWNFFMDGVKKFGPFDVAIHDGDLIDGRGELSGQRELIMSDRQIQCNMAAECIKAIGSPINAIAYGTPYHTGKLERYEDSIAREVGATIGGHLYLNIADVMFDVRHKVGGSSVPYGQNTQLNKQRSWNLEWSATGRVPKCSVFVRAHCHNYVATDMADSVLFRLPALQGMGTEFGECLCDQIVHFGFVYIDVLEGEILGWDKWIAPCELQNAKVVKLI